jgi:hypothetical protein
MPHHKQHAYTVESTQSRTKDLPVVKRLSTRGKSDISTLKVKHVSSIKDFISSVEIFRGGRTGPIWYRGCGKISHHLAPCLYRHKSPRAIEDFMALEKKLLSRFQQRSIPFLSRHMATNWEWLFLMQHYGVPTRLLDWSESPLMALFFAATSAQHSLGSRANPVFNGDAAVWLLDPVQWNRKAVDLKSFPGEVLTTDDPNANSYTPIGDVKTMKPFPIAVYGSHNSQRIVAQRGVFVALEKTPAPWSGLMRARTSLRHAC